MGNRFLVGRRFAVGWLTAASRAGKKIALLWEHSYHFVSLSVEGDCRCSFADYGSTVGFR